MRIAFYEIANWEANYIKERLAEHELSFYPYIFSDDALPQDHPEIISIFTSSPVTPKVLEHLDNLKFIATRTTGYDHINLDACKEHNVVVSNVPSYGENTVAEFTFALLLTLSRKMFQGIKRVRQEGMFRFDGLRGFDLKDKTIGVIGTGHIGTYVVKIAHGFGMNIIAYDPFPNEKLAKDYDYKYVSLEDLLAQSDIITLHVPYMPATHHLLNKDNMKLIKRGAVLINTARGALVDTTAMIGALRDGTLGGVGIDVMEEEGFIKDELDMLIHGHPNAAQMEVALADHELMHMDNVIITPHNAFQTSEAIRRILDTTVENIKAFIDGKPANLVVKK